MVLAGAVCITVLAACGSDGNDSPNASGDGGGGGVRDVAVKITSDGCEPKTLTEAPGPVTFQVTNDGADDITEFEIKQGDKILGESENLTPGLKGEFTLTLKPGTYELYCPGGDSGTLTVTGAATSTTLGEGSADASTAVDTYRTYLESETAQLKTLTQQFADAVKAGNLEEAKSLFPKAREHYETIEPVAESFGDLDPRIDAREGDVPAKEWSGFHRIEKALWVTNTTQGMTPYADQLVEDVNDLSQNVETVELEPAQIANGAVELLNEVAKSKITGEEDRYSHTDLWDFAANTTGAEQAFTALLPIVQAKDDALASDINGKFEAVNSALDKYRADEGYVSYNDLTKADTRALATKVDALGDVLAKVAPLVAQ
jgi:iron uptake system component EfeO